ncbi:hypothetical protein [Methanolapillus ohkumae]|uniref:PIN domain-containing protein n=1 Tax=Methanolapillus ohkumae TaxID=3028298 RepID=A0AA96ZXG3_9EURY|nr:hypothetical protein MsAm2_14690 [Methanosarcinaceae archaeon Am2]
MIYPIYPVSETKKNENFFIDANVLLFLYVDDMDQYQNAHKIQVYSDFVKNLQRNGNSLFVSVLNLQEVLHVIEKQEYVNYCKINHSKIKMKSYRRNDNERKDLKIKLGSVLQQIVKNYSIQGGCVTLQEIDKFVSSFDTHLYDPIDFFVIDAQCSKTQCLDQYFNYVTDDSDFKSNFIFKTNPYVNLYTLGG